MAELGFFAYGLAIQVSVIAVGVFVPGSNPKPYAGTAVLDCDPEAGRAGIDKPGRIAGLR